MSESNHEPLRLRLSGPRAVNSATDAARTLAGRVGIDESDAARLAIIIEELVTNLYDHGGLGFDDVFELELFATGEELGVVIIDPGTPFDPGLADLGRKVPRRGGGAGLKLVRAWASRTEYSSIGGFNRLAVLLPKSARED
ncbi:MAG TPA: ATP-binding protein [Sphingomicrobium sp.]|nr:ATP-binding protein [Sphingomicrobium sp.]